ncbi:MAG: matrixin family metalloprotease [Verrucomicrobiota bacterium]
MKFLFRSGLFSVGLLCSGALHSITIDLNYTYDTNGFFDQEGSKEAMRAVADYFESRINDNLLAIDQDSFGMSASWSARFTHPGTGATQSIPGLVVPEDTLVIYVGGRSLGSAAGLAGPGGYAASGTSAWIDLLASRGQAGALAATASDFGPWGGSISFDSGRSWHFELDGRPTGSNSDFVSVALHEMGHVLGVGTSSSWQDQIDANNLFQGAFSVAAFGGGVPVDSFRGHWQDDGVCTLPLGYDPENALNVLSLTSVSFGTAHALEQIALMDPSSCTVSSFTELKVLTDLDWAALRDIGWEVFLPLELGNSVLSPSGVSFTWPTSTGQSYSLEQTTDLTVPWTSVTGTVDGDGEVAVYTDASPPAGKAFYRLATAGVVASSLVVTVQEAVASEDTSEALIEFSTAEPRWVEGCGVCSH